MSGVDSTGASPSADRARGRGGGSAPTGDSDADGATTEVLAFTLDGARYCVPIDNVAEIVDTGERTEMPNASAHVVGVRDLRGDTTTIVDPKRLLGLDRRIDPKRVVVFDAELTADDGATGWLVDEVRNVTAVAERDVESPPSADGAVHGVVRQDGGFVVRLDPEALGRGR